MLILQSAGYFCSADVFSENTTPLRSVEFFELEIIQTGTGMSYINGVSYPHRKNRLILAKPGDQRFTVGAFECRFAKLICQDSAATLLRGLPDTAILESDLIESLMKDLRLLPEGCGPAARFSQQAALYALLAQAAEALRRERVPARARDPYLPAILTVKEYLDTHFGEKIGQERLADLTHMSRNFLRLKFQALIGLSPHAYLCQVRLAQAKKLLRLTSLPLAEIAVACGFDSQAYMSYQFQRHTGSTPLAFRKAGGDTFGQPPDESPQAPPAAY